MVGKVLVGLGGRSGEAECCTQVATRLGIDIALRHQAALTGVTVADFNALQWIGPAPIGAGAAAAGMRQRRSESIRERITTAITAFESECAQHALPYEVLREERAEPFDYLISQSRYHDVTVVGLHGLFEFGVLGEPHYNPADTMVRLISGGVRPLIAAGPEHREIKRVLVAYSGSPQSATTLRRYVQMDLWPDAAVRIVAFGDDHERRHRHLRHAAAYCKTHGIEVESDWRPGAAKTGVIEVAHEWDADLIVMGNSHRTLLSRKVLGDTMLETIRLSDRSLFLSQ